ncbi:hypothetical protein MJO29_010864 [Puccinia striiformis f. sp. tritici]|nr:hypothetical protein MJO29_010864 [Puccinia striiformis f. sp. tritici]
MFLLAEQTSANAHSPQLNAKLTCSNIYPHLFDSPQKQIYWVQKHFSQRALYAKNKFDVDRLNEFFANSKNSQLLACESQPIPGGDKYAFYRAKVTSTALLETFPCTVLKLKVGMPIRLTKDIARDVGLPKGTRLVISAISEDSIDAEWISPSRYRSSFSIPRLIIHCQDPQFPKYSFVRSQFPIEPCYASLLKWAPIDAVTHPCVFQASQHLFCKHEEPTAP